MADKILIRRGLKSQLDISPNEPGFTTDTHELYIGTGDGNVNISGSHWYTGTAISGTGEGLSGEDCPLVKAGDIYLNTDSGNIYTCTEAGEGTAALWEYAGCIKGDKGDKGDTGDAGADGESVTVDSALSSTSTNPVQNNAVYAKVSSLQSEIEALRNGVETLANNSLSNAKNVSDFKNGSFYDFSDMALEETFWLFLDENPITTYSSTGTGILYNDEAVYTITGTTPAEDWKTGMLLKVAVLKNPQRSEDDDTVYEDGTIEVY